MISTLGCTLEWKYCPHDCLEGEVDDCKEKCKKLERQYGGCVVVAELKFDCIDTILGFIEIEWGGKVDFVHCCCKWEGHSTEENERRRKDFNGKRDKIRKEYEEKTGSTWPTDDKGRNDDAHHVDPIEWCGENNLDNIIPVPADKHRELHKKYRACYK